jgi:protein SCO1/2/putative membrane protein
VEAAPEWVHVLPSVNASLNGLATLLLLSGYVLIRSGRAQAHKRVMLTSFGTSVAFLACYLVYHYFAGSKPFPGTGPVRTVYLGILATHVVLAAAVPLLATITIYRALKAEGTLDPALALERWQRHRAIARITFPIWLYVSITGVIIYGMLYHWPAG